jgi:signal transduction histidine kinase
MADTPNCCPDHARHLPLKAKRWGTIVFLLVFLVFPYVVSWTGAVGVMLAPHPGFHLAPSPFPRVFQAFPLTKEAADTVAGFSRPLKVRRVNDVDLAAIPSGKWIWGEISGAERRDVGAENRYVVTGFRGRTVDCTIPVSQPDLRAVFKSTALYLYSQVIGLLYALVGLFVWWRKPNDAASRPLLFLATVAAVSMVYTLPDGPITRWLVILRMSTTVFYAVTGFHLVVQFTGMYQRKWERRLIFFGIGGGILLVAANVLVRRAILWGHEVGAWRDVSSVGTGAFLLGGLFLMIWVCWRASRPSNPAGLRSRARIIAITSAVAFAVPSLLVVAVPVLGEKAGGGWVAFVNLTCLGLFPGILGYAIIRHQLFDLRIVIRRGFVYVGLSLLVSFVYVALILHGLKWLGESASTVSVGLSTMVAVLVFSLFQIRVQRAIDRFVYRSRAVYARALAKTSADLTDARTLGAIAETVRPVLLEAMGLSHAYFAPREPGTDIFKGGRLSQDPQALDDALYLLPAGFRAADFPPIERALALKTMVSSQDATVVAAQSLSRRDDNFDVRGEAGFFPHYGLEAIVPLAVGGEAHARDVVGLLLVGQKRNGRGFNREDYQLLDTLANQLAVAVETANAFEKIRGLNENLEQQVSERTLDLSAALAQLKGAQGKLIEAEKQAMLGRVVAGIVHEINTPLGTLHSATDTMGRALDLCRPFADKNRGGDDPSARAVVRAVDSSKALASVLSSSGERIREVVTGLSHFVSLDEAAVKGVDVRKSIDSAVELLSSSIGDGVRIVREYPDSIPSLICHPPKLNQVFLHLLQNALDALETRDDGGEVRIVLTVDDEAMVIRVEDSGKGIDANQMGHLFDFSLTTKKGGRIGMGLGLPASKQTIEELGGTLDVSSSPGKGTRVKIVLPTRYPNISALGEKPNSVEGANG